MKKFIAILIAFLVVPVSWAQNTAAGNLLVQQTIKFTGTATPPAITAGVDDYAPTGFATAAVVRLQSDTARTITGLAGGTAGRMVWLTNVGTATITLATESASSAAGNRFAFGATSFELLAGNSVSLWYDGTSTRWRAGTNLAAGGGGTGVVDQAARDAAAAAQSTADTALSTANTATTTAGTAMMVAQAAQQTANAAETPAGAQAKANAAQAAAEATAGAALSGHVVAADPHGDRAFAVQRANHTGTQAATTITEDATHRFATDTEKTAWNAKETTAGAQSKADAAQAYAVQRANHTGTQAATTITTDATHRFVTDTEKSTWDAKQAALVNATTLAKITEAAGLPIWNGGAWPGGGGGSGTVTTVSVVTANGISGTVADPTITPAITLTLGAITPSSVAATGTVTGSNLSGTNTGDQTNITGNAGTATALQTARTINGVSFDGTANITIPAGTGTVTGPASSTDNALVRFDSTTGTSIQNSTITLADTGALAGVDAAQFVATPTSAAADRSLRWNSTEKTLDLVNGDGTTTQLGHEQHVVIHNATGSALAEGKVVSLTGATLGGRLTAALARADQYSTSDATIGITTQAIANGVEGKVTTSGIIHDLDTSAFSPGDELYLSDTVAGGLRTTQPLAPNLVVHVGHVVVSDAVVGSIYVDPAVVSQTADSVHIDAGPGVLEMNNVQDFFRHAWSTGATEGFALTDNGDGTVNIATGEIVYRETDADDAVLTPTVVPAVTNLAMQANNVSYLYLQYGTGWQVGTALNQFDGITKVIVYLVGRNGNRLNVVDLRKINVDFGRKSRRQKAEFDGFVFGGWWRSVEAQSAITSSGLNLLVGAGKYFYFDNAITHTAFDTTVAGGADANNWITFYNRSSWTQITGQKAVNNTQWDNAGTLTAFSGAAGAARFRTDYIYVVMDGASPYLASIMGNVEYTSLATAQAAPLPPLPPHIDGIAVLVGQVVVRKNGTTVTVQRAGAASFSGTVASNLHNSLPDLQGGTVGEYYHTTAAQNGWLPTAALGTAAYTATTAYDPAGAAAAITLAGLGGVPTSRTVNGHALSADVTVTKGDVGLGSVENTALSTWGGSANLATLGTVTAGTWQGNAITDTYVASASAWNAKVSFPGFGTTNTTATVGDDARLSDARTPLAHNQAWSTITSTPTTLTGYGIADAQPLDSDLTSIAALTTTAFGRGLLTQVDAAGTRATIGAGTSSFDGAYASLSGIPSTFTPAAHNQAWSTITSTPTTLSGYGITDAQPLDTELTAISALANASGVLTNNGSGVLSWAAGGGSFDGSYNSLTDVPTSFPPSAHTQAASTISDSTAPGRGFLTTAVAGVVAFPRVNVDNTVDLRAASGMRSDLGATTMGSNIFTIPNITAVSFLRLNADETVTAQTAANFLTDIGGTTVGQSMFTLTNPGAITFPRINANNTITAQTAANFRTDLGGTTVGQSMFTLTNPGAITFPRINANNTVTALSATDFRTAIGAGSGTGDVVGPASSTRYRIPIFDSTTGKTLAEALGWHVNIAGMMVYGTGPLDYISGSTAQFQVNDPDGAAVMTLVANGASLASTATEGTYILRNAIYSYGTGNSSQTLTLAYGSSSRVRTTSVGVQFPSYGAGTLVTDSSGNITASSDRRLKNVSGKFTRGLDAIAQIQPKYFTWKPESGMNTEDENVGFIAQDVLEAIPEAVGTVKTNEYDETDAGTGTKITVRKREAAPMLTLSDRPILAALVNAVKELKTKNEELEARVAKLEAQTQVTSK